MIIFKKTAFFAAFVLFFPLSPSFAQGSDPELEIARSQMEMQDECNRIAKAVPCAVGVGDVDKLPSALAKSERDALYKLAVSVQAFVSYAAKDSSYIEGISSKEFSETIGKVNVEKLLVTNSQVIRQEYRKLKTDDGKSFYRAVSLRTLSKELYNEAKSVEQSDSGSVSSPAASNPAAAVSAKDSVNAAVLAVPADSSKPASPIAAEAQSVNSNNAQNTAAASSIAANSAVKSNAIPAKSSIKTTLTQIAKKTGSFLFSIAKKWVGL